MPQNNAIAENGRMNNGNAGSYKIPRKSFSDGVEYGVKNEGVKQNFSSTPAHNQTDGNQLLNNKGHGVSTPKLPSAPAPPVHNHGFVHNQPETPAGKADYFKLAEPKRAPSTAPDEPLKDLTPMQTMLETYLPVGANFASLPAKLSEKFTVGTCELCKVNMLSLVQSKMHYNGKPHMKKVRSFLINSCGKDEEPVLPAKVAKINFGRELKDDEEKECKICKVIFNSSVHANQHYEGKKHKKAAVNYERTGLGNDGRFGIGADFSSASDKQISNPAPSLSKPLFCEACNVQTSSSEQYKMHMEGARHAKKMRQLSGVTPDNHAANQKKRKQKEPEVSSFDLTEDEYISKYEDY